MIAGKKIVLIVTGGVAVYKIVSLARLLVKAGAEVRVVMTTAATEFVTPKTFSVLTQHDVLIDLFADTTAANISHIELADWADYMVVAPATANFLAKVAWGIADDAASTTAIARHTPMVVVPAMNSNMYTNPAVKRNLTQLKADGVQVIAPVNGDLAEGYQGNGRLPEPEAIFAQLNILIGQTKTALTGKKVLISAGGTREAIDPVRFIANRSSGKMGYAFAQAAVEQGAEVELISSVDLTPPPYVHVTKVETANELLTALQAHFSTADLVVMSAAVADYRIAQPASQKLKKQANHSGMTLNLIENPDILATLGQQKTHQYLVGFAAETENLLTHAQAKLTKKNVDLLIANDVSKAGIGFGSDQNEVTLLFKNEAPKTIAQADKQTIARETLKMINQHINKEA